jgi:hypothetical protein
MAQTRSQLTHEEEKELGYSPRLIEQANELIRKADEAERNAPYRKTQKLLAPVNG